MYNSELSFCAGWEIAQQTTISMFALYSSHTKSINTYFSWMFRRWKSKYCVRDTLSASADSSSGRWCACPVRVV